MPLRSDSDVLLPLGLTAKLSEFAVVSEKFGSNGRSTGVDAGYMYIGQSSESSSASLSSR